ncbi:MAG: alkaline phosphatase family protein [Myxococcota bacterium]
MLLALLPACMGRFQTDPKTGDCPPPVEDDEPTDTGPLEGPLVEHVVVLVMDGARLEETLAVAGTRSDAADADVEEIMPAVRERLVPAGTIVAPGIAAGIPITGPGHSDILTGVRQSYGHFPTPEGGGWYRPELPTLYELWTGFAEPEAGQLVLTGNTEHVEPLTHSVYPGSGEAYGADYSLVLHPEDTDGTRPADVDAQVVEAVLARLASDRPALIVANLHGIDRAGHYETDTNPTAYADRLTGVDESIADAWDAIQADPDLKDRTLLIVTTDHGRHEWGDGATIEVEGEDVLAYSAHGDQCTGCREIPMLILGPRVHEYVTVERLHTLEDVSATIAWALGVDHPYTTGIVIGEAFDCEVPEGRTGEIAVDASGELRAAQVWNTDASARSAVVVDGETLSTEDAWMAEAPRVLSAAGRDFACWRELAGEPSDDVDWPWTAQCRLRADGGEWDDIGFPVEQVYPLFEAAMTVDGDGALLVAWADNPNATTYSDTRAWIRLLRHTDADGWTGAEEGPGAVFPTSPSVTTMGGKAWVAWAASDLGGRSGTSNDPGRYTRHVAVARVSMGADGAQGWTEVWRTYDEACPDEAQCQITVPTLDAEGNEYGRMETPAIAAGPDGLLLGFVAYGEEVGNTILFASSDATGETWSTPERVDASERVFGHLAPRWGDGWLHWARLSDAGEAEVCRWQPGVVEAECQGVGSSRVNGLAPVEGGALVSVDRGVGQWASETVSF